MSNLDHGHEKVPEHHYIQAPWDMPAGTEVFIWSGARNDLKFERTHTASIARYDAIRADYTSHFLVVDVEGRTEPVPLRFVFVTMETLRRCGMAAVCTCDDFDRNTVQPGTLLYWCAVCNGVRR